MPRAAGRPCVAPGCGVLTASGQSRCAKHPREPFGRRQTPKRTYGRTYRQMRARVIARDGKCVECDATDQLEVDHIDRAGPDSLSNLRTLCSSCHATHTAEQSHASRRAGPTRAACVAVCGPPGAGKSTYVGERAKPGELVVDFDELYAALSGRPAYDKPAAVMRYVSAARDAVVALLATDRQRPRSWVIASAPRASERERFEHDLAADVVVLAPSAAESLRRIAADERRRDRAELWKPVIERWWERYEARDADEVIQ